MRSPRTATCIPTTVGMADVISHQASECTVCKDYVLHISEALMDNDKSYLDGVDKQESNWIPIREHQ